MSNEFSFEGRLNTLLSKHRVADVVTKRPVLSVLDTAPVAATYALLAENSVLSVPVLKEGSSEHEPLGYVDVAVLARYMLLKLLPAGSAENNATVGALESKEVAAFSFDGVTNGQLLDELSVGAVVPFFDGNPATYLPRLFTSHLHRTIVYSEVTKPDGVHRELKMTGICSQTDLVRYLARLVAEDEALAAAAEASLRKSGYRPQAGALGSVSESATVLQALHQMSFSGHRAVAITADADGTFKGAFTLGALRGLKPDQLGELTRPVLEFVRQYQPAALEPATVKLDGSLRDALDTFVGQHLHEAWIVGSDGVADGVVTQTDIIGMLTRRGAAADEAAEEKAASAHAFRLPGRLFIKVASGAGLVGGTLFKTVRAGVRVTFGAEKVLETDALPGRSPAWGNTHTVEVSEAAARENRALVFEVFDESQGGAAIGYFKVSLKWILSAFGTGQPALRNFADAFRIRKDNQPGEVQVEFLWLD